MAAPALTLDIIQKAPKVLLHDHLDGGLRPATVVEIAGEIGYTGLPTNDLDDLREWFIADTPGSDLVRYLEGFAHTTVVMQTAEHLERVASECAVDLARDGVVYAEVRFAPELHMTGGLTLHEIVLREAPPKPQGPVLFKSCGWAGWDLAAARTAVAIGVGSNSR